VETNGDLIPAGPITFDPAPIRFKHHEEVEGLQEDGMYLLFQMLIVLGLMKIACHWWRRRIRSMAFTTTFLRAKSLVSLICT
jgi:hypothetical protein